MSETDYMKVGEMARRAGVSPRTVRYYEELGLLEPSERSQGGFRLYTEDDLERLQIIEELKLLDFQLGGIRDILQQRRQSSTGAESTKAVAGWITDQVDRLDFLLDKYRGMKEDMQRTLTILDSCAVCNEKPSREICLACPAVQEAGGVTRLLTAMM
jgi:MerR family Zn(II)-responsive transcriptional regulator of zntA